MTSRADTTPNAQIDANDRVARIQRRHTLAAIVYFIYGLFYLFGAQYVTSTGMSTRGASSSAPVWFVIGGVILILFPILIYRTAAIPLPLGWIKPIKWRTLHISFTLLLSLAVVARVISLIRLEFYAKSPLHMTGLIVVMINAAFLLRAGLSRPFWVSRQSAGVD